MEAGITEAGRDTEREKASPMPSSADSLSRVRPDSDSRVFLGKIAVRQCRPSLNKRHRTDEFRTA